MLDRHTRRRWRNRAIGWVGPPIAHNWTRSLRMRWIAEGTSAAGDESGRIVIPNTIALVWHQRLFVLATRFAGSGFATLVSRHADGEMLVKILAGLGITAIRGSTTRGGVQAVRELLGKGEGPVRIAITPDGPRGPPCVVQPGSIWLAARTGLPITPCAIGLERPWALRSWDRFWIPRPFSRALMRFGKPITVPADLEREELETWRERIERTMRELNDDTDARFDELWAGANPWRGFRG